MPYSPISSAGRRIGRQPTLLLLSLALCLAISKPALGKPHLEASPEQIQQELLLQQQQESSSSSSSSIDHDSSESNSAVVCPPTWPFVASPDSCSKFYRCSNGKPFEVECPMHTVFNPQFRVCVMAGSELDTCSPQHALRECERGDVDLIPHPTRCQGYYNCSDPVPPTFGGAFSNKYEKECKHPDQYDINLKKCVSYKQVTCGQGRKLAKWFCDYVTNQCHVSSCYPCRLEHPSCVGKEDGLYPAPYSMWSKLYFRCQDERCTDGGMQFCKATQIFNPNVRRCVHKLNENL